MYKKMKWSDILTIISGKNQKGVASEDGEYFIYGSGGIIGRWTFRSIIIRGNFPTANASVIGGYNPKFVTGFVRVFAVCLSECTDIMPISM